MKRVLLTGLVLGLFSMACAPVPYEEPVSASASGADLTGSLNDPNTMAAKSERALRKLRLAQVLTTHKLGILTADLSRCFATTSSNSYWDLNCGEAQAVGRLSFVTTQNVLNSMELESSTPVTGFGAAKELLQVSEITGQTETDGTQIASFKLNWSLYKDSFVDSAKICSATTGRIYVSVKNGALVSLTTSRITLSCKGLESGATTNSFSMDLSNLNLTPNADSQWIGQIPFVFASSSQQFSGTLSLDDEGLVESKNNIRRPWQCFGAALCFP